MAAKRHKPQEYTNAAALTAETLVPESNDLVIVESTGRMYNWVVGSSATADNESVITQTSESANGRWIALTASMTKLTGTITFPALANSQSAVATSTVSGLPIGTAIVVNISNGNTAYTGSTEIPSGVTIFQGMVTAANTVAMQIINETGAAIDGFTANIVVAKL